MPDSLVAKASIDTGLSLYLDCLRFVAAILVLLFHMEASGFQVGGVGLHHFGHESVIIFFVLSGFVIARSTLSEHRKSPSSYVLARMARIYSVAVPAIVFGVLLSAYFLYAPGDIPEAKLAERQWSVWSVISSLLFLNQSWMNEARAQLNIAYWSLSYEVWYYVLFGILIFARAGKRWLLFGVAAAIAGPKIIALAPLWALGAALAIYGIPVVKSKVLGTGLFVGSILIFLLLGYQEWDAELRGFLRAAVPGFWRLDESQNLMTDYLIGMIVAVNFIGFQAVKSFVSPALVWAQKPIRYCASCSFTLYLFHMPLLLAIRYLVPSTTESVTQSAAVFLAVPGFCFVLAKVSEHQTARWRRFFAHILPVASQIHGK